MGSPQRCSVLLTAFCIASRARAKRKAARGRALAIQESLKFRQEGLDANHSQLEASMPHISRRSFLITSTAALGARALPSVALRQRRVLTLVYDKSLGMMRAVDRLVP